MTVSRWRHLPALLIAVGGLAPFVFVVTGSLREPGPPPRTPRAAPVAARRSATTRPRSTSSACSAKLVNSLVVAAVAVPLAVLVASAAGFGLARLPRRPRRIVAAVTIGAAMVPTTALLVGRFGLFRALGVTDTLLPLMAPALLGESPFHVLFYLWAFRRISAGDLRRRPPRGDERARRLLEGGHAARQADHARRRRVQLRRPVGCLHRAARLPVRSRPVHRPDGSRHAGQPRPDATSRCCWPAPSRRWRR